tara:strand:+ start:57 stop:614 length:558 start_codon:yes stop_codon:yes gene_type:complete
MINNIPVYNYMKCAVYNSVTSLWVDILADGIEVAATRGGDLGLAGIASVDVGSLSLRLLDVYDPAQVAFLKPNMPIVLYNNDPSFATPRTTGAIFTGMVQDINATYELDDLGKFRTYVNIYAADSVSSHTNIPINGFKGTTFNGVINTANGYQRWEDRIRDLNTQYARSTITNPTISANVEVYSI